MREQAVRLAFEFRTPDGHSVHFGYQVQPSVLAHLGQAAFDVLLDLEEVVAGKTVRL